MNMKKKYYGFFLALSVVYNIEMGENNNMSTSKTIVCMWVVRVPIADSVRLAEVPKCLLAEWRQWHGGVWLYPVKNRLNSLQPSFSRPTKCNGM